jgi:hypothetical protein
MAGQLPRLTWRALRAAARLTSAAENPRGDLEAIERRDAGDTLTDIARTYGVSHTTIMRLTAAPDR